MAWCLVRGTILRRVRSETLTRKLRGSFLRSVSSYCDENPEGEKDPDRTIVNNAIRFVRHAIRCQKKTGIVYKSLNLICYDSIFDTLSLDSKLEVLSKVFDQIRNLPQANPYEVYLMNIYIKSMRNDDTKTDVSYDDVISRVLDVIRNHPTVCRHYKVTEETHLQEDLMFDEFDFDQLHKALYLEFKTRLSGKVFFSRTCKEIIDSMYERCSDRLSFDYFRSKNNVGEKFWPMPICSLSKDIIIARVLYVTQSYPKVGDYKVTEETHFYKDLGFDKWDFIDVIQALQTEFRLCIPDDIVSCKLAIEYIYDHRMESLRPKEFMKRLFLTGEFGESKSEFRRMFVPEGEKGTMSPLSDARHNNLYSGFTIWNGFKQFQFFKDLDERWLFY